MTTTATKTPQNYEAVRQGLIPLTAQERIKQEKDGLDVIHDIYRYAQEGFEAITDDDFERFKWYGVYRQKPKESGYFMLRTKVPGGQLTGAQACKLSDLAERYGRGFCDLTTRQTVQMHWLRIEDMPHHLRRTGRGRHHDERRVRRRHPQRRRLPGGGRGCHRNHRRQPADVGDQPRNSRTTARFPTCRASTRSRSAAAASSARSPTSTTWASLGCGAADEAGYGVKVGGGLSAAPHMAQLLPVFIRPAQVWPVTEAITTFSATRATGSSAAARGSSFSWPTGARNGCWRRSRRSWVTRWNVTRISPWWRTRRATTWAFARKSSRVCGTSACRSRAGACATRRSSSCGELAAQVRRAGTGRRASDEQAELDSAQHPRRRTSRR